MKTFLYSVVLALILLGAFCGLLLLTAQSANARPTGDRPDEAFRTAVFKAHNQAMVYVLVDKLNHQPSIIEIKNKNGQLVWNQVVSKKTTKFRLKLNLTELPDGQYTVSVVSGKDKMDYPVLLSTSAPIDAKRELEVN
ncbi:hypothetical protein G8759_05830 [Spirosoma aureum]|uniref:Copper resistance protein CopC n=1 Tax=Spirosoma aureum TaxID=2692134 RepID=A0A6G9AJ27_9BACT|nr:hypothetical protein [Spirosoma aureum]QIP12183.1 hypothetical protein G8759_05830 [Spirosoma aureum]